MRAVVVLVRPRLAWASAAGGVGGQGVGGRIRGPSPERQSLVPGAKCRGARQRLAAERAKPALHSLEVSGL